MSGRTVSPPDIPGYRYLEYLNHGGCSTVYLYERLGHTDELNREVAIKVLTDLGLPDIQRKQFIVEAQAMMKLGNHPNIVQVLDAAQAPDGRPFIVMQYYPNENLAAVAAREPFQVDEALEIGVKVSSAVEAAHRAGILHRDIKPANILMDEYGQPGLTDFGIAGRLDAGGEDDVGLSIPWSPPEALDRGSELMQSDVYSLAATVWHLLVGRSPFDVPGDNSVAAIQRRIRAAPRPATGRPGVPPSLDRLLQKGLAIEAADRPATALEFAQRLQRIEDELGLRTTPTTLAVGRRSVERVRAPADGATRLRALLARAAATSWREPATRPATAAPATYIRPPLPEIPRYETPPGVRPLTGTLTGEPDPGRTQPRTLQPSALQPPAPEPTWLRPPASDSAPKPASQLQPPKRPAWVWLAATATSLVVIAVVSVVLLADRTPAPAASGPTTSQTADGRQDAGVPGANVPPGTPTVVATRIDGSTLRFTWTYSAQLGSDSFSWQTKDGARTGVVTSASVDLAAAAGTEVCVQVKVVRADGSYAATDWSPAGCGS